MSLILTKALVGRFDAVDVACTRLRMEAIRQVAGESAGIRFPQHGSLLGLMAPAIPNPHFNRIVATGAIDVAKLVEIMNVFDEGQATPSFEISPGQIDADGAAELARRGFAHTAFHPVFAATRNAMERRARPETPSTVKVVKIAAGADLSAFKAVYLDGWDVWSGIVERLSSYMDRWPGFDAWRLFLATDGGAPAAAAILHVSDGIGYLADAATAKAFRRRGCQQVLLQARIDAALESGCDFVVSRAEFDSVSHHNIEKSGVPMIYARAVWTKLSS